MLLAVLLVGCKVDSARQTVGPSVGDGGSLLDQYMARYGGSDDVYSEILAEADCTNLQASADHASALHDAAEAGSDQARATTGYLAAIDDRMRAIGCS
jgi:hypothetical protein